MSSFEDKMVELATKRVLEPLFEPLFEDCSYGYRPKRSPHQCLDTLGRTIQQKRVHHLVEADIRGFFDAVNHEVVYLDAADNSIGPRIRYNPPVSPPSEGVVP